MRLTQHTDYALRMLIHAALRAPSLITAGEQGLVQTVRGRSGGLRLMREPDTIRLGEVVRR